jgi:hypothetical protein
MTKRFVSMGLLVATIGLLFDAGTRPPAAAALSDPQRELLANSRYVYISSQRKDGGFGAPAEIWYFFHDGAIWVGTTPQSWRAKRIKAGRPNARIAIGKTDGPTLAAKGEIVKDPKVEELMFTAFANKYPEGWPKHEQRFRSGFKDGSRILIKYTPSE